MLNIDRKTLILSTILTALMTPGIFGQQSAEPREDKTAVANDTSNEARKEKKENENKDISSPEGTFKYASSAFTPESKFKPRRGSADTSEPAAEQEDAAALAKKMANPVASLISLPFQSNFDFGMGANGNGFRYTLNVQPVIPIALSKDWNLISRTIVPIMAQSDVVAPGSHQFGLGDTVEALFFSPNKTEPFIWAVGPQVLIPTATDQYLGGKKLGLGPTFLILKQTGPWTVGALTGHFWSVAGSSSRPPVNLTNIQPFLAYGTKSAWTFTFNTESSYDWRAKQWNVPIHIIVTKLVRLGKQPVSIGGSIRCWAVTSPSGPSGCGFRFIFAPLFPRKVG